MLKTTLTKSFKSVLDVNIKSNNIKYETTIKNDGNYHENNRLNDLRSKTWLKFQKSWFILNPKPRPKTVMLHPAKFPEELVEYFVTFFTKEGQTVLDPMVGTGSTAVACLNNKRSSIGIELSDKYSNIAAERIKEMTSDKNDKKGDISTRIYNGNAKRLEELDINNIDYCITSPPYWDMLLEKGHETQKERKKNQLDTHYSNDTEDLGNIRDYEAFLDELTNIYSKVFNVLKPGGYLTVIVKNVKKKGKIYPLAWDISRKLNNFFELKDEKIWCQDNTSLAPYGYRYAWVSNTVHHYCLNFRKELEIK